MPQPTFENLFGDTSSVDPVTGNLTITRQALIDSGIDNPNTAEPLIILAGVTKTASSWLENNTDTEVQASSRVDINAPFFRNNEERTSFIFNMQFFTAYNAPLFDPDDIG